VSRVALVSLVVASVAFAGEDGGIRPPVELHVRAVPATAKLGEPFEVEIVVTHDRAQRYELATPGDLGDFEFLGSERRRVDGSETSTTTFKAKLSAFQLGKLKTPAFSLEVTDPAGVVQVPVGPTDVEIVSTLPADAKDTGANLYDVRPPEMVAVRTWRVLYALAALLAAGILGWLGYRLYQNWKTKKVLEVAPPKPLHTRTIEALDALAKENLPAQARGREFFFRLSEILRGYLGDLYLFNALESTTPELLEELRSRYTPGLEMEAMTAFANHSDFVRYAKTTPTADECKSVLELAYRIVHSTTAAAAAMQQPPANGPQRAP
jgi:hypothetical protein